MVYPLICKLKVQKYKKILQMTLQDLYFQKTINRLTD
jgi:hypothetical protein